MSARRRRNFSGVSICLASSSSCRPGGSPVSAASTTVARLSPRASVTRTTRKGVTSTISMPGNVTSAGACRRAVSPGQVSSSTVAVIFSPSRGGALQRRCVVNDVCRRQPVQSLGIEPVEVFGARDDLDRLGSGRRDMPQAIVGGEW